MQTPFPFETIAPKEFFYGRQKELEELKSHVKTCSNVLLFSKRRMGKSTLIKNLFEEIDKDYTVIYIDIYNIITAEDFGKLLLNGITKSQKGDIKSSILKLTQFFKRTKVEPTFDPQSGEMGIRAVTTALSFDELMEDSFNALFKLAKEKNVILAIDEFQQIADIKNVKIDAILRKYMQEAKNISYIFLGSKRNILNSLFAYKSPLYAMATPMSLQPLQLDDIYNYSKKHLNISKEIVEYIYNLSAKETKLIQMILHRIYVEKDNIEKIDENLVDKILETILISKNDHYKSLFEFFSTNQKKAFKLLAKHERELFHEKILREENISRPSMQSSLNQLFAKEFIDKEDGEYFIPDRAFELWAKKKL
ncbi:ATPase [Malaciobacter pacificus]|uniref:ATP-binding protein n=1 Tax=Malaciobacter pacificus TaxID=1080223 RepID=A0A5C2HDB7_9BACT|nr:ATP-binding protein [Malaciobacter pacificus]QEP35555.1 ATP-binding protein [Malaciobacter pacificus]GGD41758.1 ATPase [Malaciobacter pacificus]